MPAELLHPTGEAISSRACRATLQVGPFGFPRHNQAMMNYFKDLTESGLFRRSPTAATRWRRSYEEYRYVETGQKVGNVVITVEQEGLTSAGTSIPFDRLSVTTTPATMTRDQGLAGRSGSTWSKSGSG